MIAPITPFTKTRLAPTPSGFLHMGNVLSFAITVAIARKNHVKILLRIDDLDKVRAKKLYIQDIFDTLNFLEIPWDEGPRNVSDFEDSHSQFNRIHLYRDRLQQLADSGLVFACTCSRTQVHSGGLYNPLSCTCIKRQIPLDTESASWRLVTGNSPDLAVKNLNGQVIQAALPPEMHNFIVKKKDGFPAYQLTSVVDDLFYGIDFVVRGEDLWPSTLAQHELSFALGKSAFGNLTFYHHPLLMDAAGKKLSKSAGATSIKHLRENGKHPAEIYQLIANLLGIDEPVVSWEQLGGIVS